MKTIINNILRLLLSSQSTLLLIVFLLFAPLALITSLSMLTIYTSKKTDSAVLSASSTQREGGLIFSSLPDTLPGINFTVTETDARPEIIKQYLERYNSPISHLAKNIVDTADKYHLDYRLTTAIAQQESNLCKKIPDGTFNCWGWGIHSRGTLGFSSYEEGISIVTQGLREKYIDEGLVSANDIMKKYTPLSPGSWADGVNLFLSQMQ